MDRDPNRVRYYISDEEDARLDCFNDSSQSKSRKYASGGRTEVFSRFHNQNAPLVVEMKCGHVAPYHFILISATATKRRRSAIVSSK